MSYERGTVIAGKYRIERVIGEGGMGIVLAARHLGLDEMVAVKLIREERAAGTDALARFQREARAAARIRSEHVARVFDVDFLPEGDPYIVMELIDGVDLHALVKQRGRLEPDEAITFLTQACEGVAEAHALGMVHRDLKLKNLFLTKRRDGRPLIKVIDFGVVKLSQVADVRDLASSPSATSQLGGASAREASLTGATALVGSVHYMAPEQIRASNVVDARADVWSLGVCLYAMLTGALPFDGDTVAGVCASIQGRPAPNVRAIVRDVPPEIAAAVERALERDVRRRFANVAQFAEAVALFSPDRGASVRIQAILESGPHAHEFVQDANATKVPGIANELTQDMSRAFTGGRPESTEAGLSRAGTTVDAATLSSHASDASATVPPGRPGRRWSGALLLVATAASTATLWATLSPNKAQPTADRATKTTREDSPSLMPTADPVAIATAALSASLVVEASARSAVATAPPQATPPPQATHPKRLPKAPKTAGVPTSPPPPRPEPSSAYDRF